MAVTHYNKDGKILCGTKGKAPFYSTDKKKVTCKKCLKKMQSVNYSSKSSDSNNLNPFKIANHKSYKYCLTNNSDAFIKIGDNDTDTVKTIVILNSNGQYGTSMKFAGKNNPLKKDETDFLKNYFDKKKADLGRSPLVNEVMLDFC
jgi:hypothetical protein